MNKTSDLKSRLARPWSNRPSPFCLRERHLRRWVPACLLGLTPFLPISAATLLVWPESPNPTPPYADWSTAAQTIQAAVDAAQPGDTVLATNGVYASGGRAVYGLMTNRVAVDKAITVQSVNGPEVTIIRGYQVPGGWNGCEDGAIRCAYLANGALLAGFTLTNGGVRAAVDTTDEAKERSGGGVWCESTNAVVTNCVLLANGARSYGGGAYRGTLKHCILTGNAASAGGGVAFGALINCRVSSHRAESGGGTYSCAVTNCTLTANSATNGGGACYGVLNNCTVTANSAYSGGGANTASLYNCILYGNTGVHGSNYYGGTYNYCCTTPDPGSGSGNTITDPQLTSDFHLYSSSPCRGAGSAAYSTGVDIDGEAWLNPPSIGCDEYWAGGVTGPLTVGLQAANLYVTPGFAVRFTATILGRSSASVLQFGDGTVLTNQFSATHAWSDPGDHTVLLTAYNDTYPSGVSTSVVIRVMLQPVHYVAAGNAHPVPPYGSWDTAAVTIQDAVDAAGPSALVLVSNGVYAVGGRAVYGSMTNRVAVDKPITVQSVNGPYVTMIRGYHIPGATNGDGAIRCVYLASGAILSGFTLTNGAVRSSLLTADGIKELNGGGVWCESPSTVVSNCVLTANAAHIYGGGAYQGTLKNCILAGNTAWAGGGVAFGVLNNCGVSGNRADNGGGTYSCGVTNCTLTGNTAGTGGGAQASTLVNSIIWANTAATGANYTSDSLLDYCCTTPGPASGTGNSTADPQLTDAIHLSSGSPCRWAGNMACATGVDIDGETWRNPPSIGCDEYHAEAVTGPLTVTIGALWTNVASGCPVELSGTISGRMTDCVWDFGDGTVLSNQFYASHAWSSKGEFEVVLRAYNASFPDGVSAAVMIQVGRAVHYVAVTSTNPVPPYSSWATAAQTIQDAVDAAETPGALVLVTNGVYVVGGRAVYGSMTNRVAVDRPLRVQSLNGPETTVIQGCWVSGTTNGNGAIRCVYLTNKAVLSGFTLTNGATRTSGDAAQEQSGGGVWCESTDVVVSNCIVCANAANAYAGGAFGGTLDHCTLTRNWASGGGGAFSATVKNSILSGNHAGIGGGARSSTLNNCTLTGNAATGPYEARGGGASESTLNNCTVTGNSATAGYAFGGGVYAGTLNNCIVYFNTATESSASVSPNYDPDSALNFCCTTPLPAHGTGNTSADPQLASASHLSSGSPCRGAGSKFYANGVDIDGEAWANPPSMGCDENWAGGATGPLTAAIEGYPTIVPVGVKANLTGWIAGHVAASAWDFGDGTVLSNQPYASHTWIGPGDYVVSLWAYNDSLSNGINATVTVRVVPHHVSATSTNPVPPYTSWDTAAQSIQAAVDVAQPGAVVLVNDGVYDTGSRGFDVRVGNVFYRINNRVFVDKAITLQSVNGPDATIIQGHQVSGTTNGDGAIRCVYLASGSVLSGFTLTGGATTTNAPFNDSWNCGGGVFCESAGAQVTNCNLSGNSAVSGGGAYGGTLYYCTVTANWAALRGGGVWFGSLTNCTLISNSSSNGGGAHSATLNNCTLATNTAQNGGGVYSGTLTNCTLSGNSATATNGLGGGACSGTLNNCTLSGNSAVLGGGAGSSSLNNCSLTCNWATNGGGAYTGTLNNCTLTGNSAANGGGANSANLNNCILYYNAGVNGSNFYGGTLNYCCTTPIPGNGSHTMVAEPALASASHLSVGSPCRGGGSAAYATGVDIDGEAWLTPPSIGCDEYRSGTDTGPVTVAINAPWATVPVGLPLNFTAWINGQVSTSTWEFGDGIVLSNRPYASHTWSTPGDYRIVLSAYNTSHPEGVSATITLHVLSHGVHYVSPLSANPRPPFFSWEAAARTIQDAVDAATGPGAIVWVTNGLYTTGGRAITGLMTNRVAITNALSLCSVNGPEVTIIRGYQVPVSTNGDGAIRCVQLANGAVLSGFTLTNGATRISGDAVQERNGGGVWCASTNVLITNCIISRNSALQGGGVYYGTLDHCTLTGNWAAYSGGGAYYGGLNNCTLADNWAGTSAAGAYHGTLRNCSLAGNSAPRGGGASGSTLYNCILWHNTATISGSNYDTSTLTYCSTTPLPTNGVGNITNEPLFADYMNRNLRLQSNSPCINAGNNAYAFGSTDLGGLPRIVGGTVDIGAYEFQAPTSALSYAWLQQFNLPTDGSADYTDPDHDGLNNWQEWRCGTDPTNPLSALRLLPPTHSLSGVAVTWQSVTNRAYFLERSTNLGGRPVFQPLATNLPGQPGTTTFKDSNAPGSSPVFYRAGIQP